MYFFGKWTQSFLVRKEYTLYVMVGEKNKPVYVVPVGICWLVVVKKRNPTVVVPVGIRRLVMVKKKKPLHSEGVSGS